jgi:transposase
MANCMMIGCDLHDKSMLLKGAVDRGEPWLKNCGTSSGARQRMVDDLYRKADKAGASRIIFAYEACGFGFLLHDELVAAGIECYIVAPSKMPRSAHSRKRKTDERDAQAILDALRSFILAGVALPSIWVPPMQTRDDRELVRRRLSAAEDVSATKTRIHWLLKQHGIEGAETEPWTEAYWIWLDSLIAGPLRGGAGASLSSLMRQLKWLQGERALLDDHVIALSRASRYSAQVAALCRQQGVGVLTAMVFLTELGDLHRFNNRREVGSFLGLTPACHESGENSDHKGHITHQGPSRVRKVLCQAVWSRLRVEPSERESYDRLVARNPGKKKVAVVARMRVLAIRMWHDGLAAQEAMEAAAHAA